MEAYLNKAKRLQDELHAKNLPLPSKMLAALLLNNLTPEYDPIVAIISQTIRADKENRVDLTPLFNQLIDESRRLKNRSIEAALLSQNSTKSTKRTKSTKKCLNCHKKGHLIDDCWFLHPEKAPKKAKKDAKTDKGQLALNTTEDSDAEIVLSTILAKSNNPNTWILDSGATSHICAFKSLFIDLKPCKKTIYWGNASSISINWIGTVKIAFIGYKRTIILNNVLYIPEIGLNLLSLGQLAQKGVVANIGLKSCDLIYKATKIATGKCQNNLILFKSIEKEDLALTSTIKDEALWHTRMGHLGNKALGALSTKTEGCQLAQNAKNHENCDICVKAKAIAKISYKPMPRALNYLDKVHTDICGPIAPETYDKKRYFISFIDDKTRYATIYLIRTREETFSIFSKWLNIEENQENTLLKRLHSDNAKEYKSGDFIDLFNAKGIKSTFTAPYTLEQNGIAERFNRTIVSKIRALLYTAKLPNYY